MCWTKVWWLVRATQGEARVFSKRRQPCTCWVVHAVMHTHAAVPSRQEGIRSIIAGLCHDKQRLFLFCVHCITYAHRLKVEVVATVLDHCQHMTKCQMKQNWWPPKRQTRIPSLGHAMLDYARLHAWIIRTSNRSPRYPCVTSSIHAHICTTQRRGHAKCC